MHPFLHNKHTRWYFSIVDSRRLTPATNRVEHHHVIPRSMGGTNDRSNIVKLTTREHFVCHRLLVRMTTGRHKHKMSHALWMMMTAGRYCNTSVSSSLIYAWAKRLKSEASRGNRWAAGKHSPERIEKNRQTQRIVQNNPELRAKIASTVGTPEYKARASAIQSTIMSRPEVRDKIRLKHNKPVVQIDLQTGTIINVFPSGKTAERATGVGRSHISSCVHNTRAHAGGYGWQALEGGTEA